MRPRFSPPAVRLVAILTGGCGPALPGTDDTGSTAATTEVVMPTTGGVMGTSIGGTSGSSGMASTGSEVSSSGTSSGGDDSTLMTVPDVGVVQCNPFTQDCPSGQKCMPYSEGGGGSWNNDKCLPVMESPAQFDEPCFTIGGGTSGIDNCDIGLMCWGVDAEMNGTCIALCIGSADEPVCDLGYLCKISSEPVLPLCIPACNPLLQDCDDVCIPNRSGVGFCCVFDASGDEGQQHDPCEFANACDPGLYCAEVTAAVECDLNATGCCQPYCDLNAMNTCAGQGQVCVSFFNGTPPPEYENIGYCAVPE